ncbi:MAG: hypothetical protein KJ062_23870 [Thermoanaerobaculia bacterium]|nr:hypothetical protein [Thermoanaerobaculia bacterium]
MGPRTKKSPTSPTAKQIDVEPKMEAPEGGSATILPPDDLRSRVAALECALATFAVHLPVALFDARRLADRRTAPVLDELVGLFHVTVSLARLRLPEEAYDVAFTEWDALPAVLEKRVAEVDRRLGKRFSRLAEVSR